MLNDGTDKRMRIMPISRVQTVDKEDVLQYILAEKCIFVANLSSTYTASEHLGALRFKHRHERCSNST